MTYLQDLIPASNVIVHPRGLYANRVDRIVEAYNPKPRVISCFIDDDESPDWARKAARYLDDEFMADTPGKKKLLSDVTFNASGDGMRMDHFRHALEAYEALPLAQRGHPPFAMDQDRGSCVDASCAEHESALFGYRAAHPEICDEPEEWLHSSAWYKYGDRGYCSDGWNGSGIATVARRVGCAFMVKYNIDGKTVDFSDENQNERVVGSSWCRSGIPDWMKNYTQANHAYEDGAIVRFQGGLPELKAAFAEGGVVHTSGRRTSGGSKPFSVGSVGPHMQSGIGADDSPEMHRFIQDKVGVKLKDGDFFVWMNQTWMTQMGRWKGELSSEYWPPWYGSMYPGVWLWKASQVLSQVSCDYVWFPRVKGFPSGDPKPPPTPGKGNLTGDLFVDGLAIEGELCHTDESGCTKYVMTPSGRPNIYNPVLKPVL